MPAQQSESCTALTFRKGVTQGGQRLKARGEVVGHGAVRQVSKGVPQCGQLPVQDGQHPAWVRGVDHQVVQPATASPSQESHKPTAHKKHDVAGALTARQMQQKACFRTAMYQSIAW